MVLILRRWCLVLLVAVAAIAAAYLPPNDITESRNWGFWGWTAPNATRHSLLVLAAERWAALSEQQAARIAPAPGDRPQVIARDALLPELKSALDSIVAVAWRSAPRHDSTTRLRVVIWAGSDTNDVGSMIERSQVLLPEITNGRTCLVLAPRIRFGLGKERNTPQWWRVRVRSLVNRALAPCVLRAAFGPPGPAVAQWMAEREYDFALSITWAVGGGMVPNEWEFNDFDMGEESMPAIVLRFAGALPRPYLYSQGAAGCAGGRSERCAEEILAPRMKRSEPGLIRLPSTWRYRRLFLSRYDRSFVSDLIQERGQEAFGHFWTSPLPVEAAFQQTYGESLGEWAYHWVMRREGGIELGAALHPAGALAGLLAAFLAVAITAVAARSREMS
jgi:hypothetical protein